MVALACWVLEDPREPAGPEAAGPFSTESEYELLLSPHAASLVGGSAPTGPPYWP